MSIAEFLKEPSGAAQQKEQKPPQTEQTAKLRKQVFLGFGVIAVLGLALTGSYVASRVFAGAGKTTSSPTVAVVVQPVAQPTAVVRPSVSPAATAAPPPPMVPVPTVVKPVTPVIQPKPTALAKPQAPTAKAKVTPAEPTSSPLVIAKLIPEQAPPVKVDANFSFQRHDLNAHHGEKYLQIAAYGPKSLDAYLKVLERQGMHPLVAPGPVENIYRVVIGPFPDADALEKARRSIEAEGIEPILRAY